MCLYVGPVKQVNVQMYSGPFILHLHPLVLVFMNSPNAAYTAVKSVDCVSPFFRQTSLLNQMFVARLDGTINALTLCANTESGFK